MYWREWFQGLLALIVILGVAELLLPSGELAKFAKLVLGFALMMAFLQPLAILFNQNFELLGGDWLPLQAEVDLGYRAEKLRFAAALPFMQNPTALEAMLQSMDQIQSVQVEVGATSMGTPQLIIWISPFEKQLKEKVSQVVSTVLNLERSQIIVEEGPK